MVETITGLDNLDMSEVTNMSRMFWGCEALTSLDLSGFATWNAPDMNHMFYMCTSLESLYLGEPFEPGSDVTFMFSGCSSELWVYGAKERFVNIITNDWDAGWENGHMHFAGY